MKKYAVLTDTELLKLLQEDEMNAFVEIYNRYWEPLFSEAYKRLKNRDHASEVLQDYFISLWERRNKIQIETSFKGYLFKSISYQIIDFYRKEAVRKKHNTQFGLTMAEVDQTTEDVIISKNLSQIIEAEVNLLPEKCRHIYELSRNQHKTNKEIASFLNISEKTVENHLTKALRKLRSCLAHLSYRFLFFL
jgi:RNA polymerase sigma-70 factor (ECF subfamily)